MLAVTLLTNFGITIRSSPKIVNMEKKKPSDPKKEGKTAVRHFQVILALFYSFYQKPVKAILP